MLTPGRYVGAEAQEDDGEPFEEKMKRLAATLREQQAEAANWTPPSPPTSRSSGMADEWREVAVEEIEDHYRRTPAKGTFGSTLDQVFDSWRTGQRGSNVSEDRASAERQGLVVTTDGSGVARNSS